MVSTCDSCASRTDTWVFYLLINIWQAEDELPERLIGSVRFEHLDLKTAAYLDDESGKIYKNEK